MSSPSALQASYEGPRALEAPGGSALYLMALLAAQSVTRHAAWRAVMRARLITVAACGAIVAAGALLPPVATAAILLVLLAGLVGAEGTFTRLEA